MCLSQEEISALCIVMKECLKQYGGYYILNLSYEQRESAPSEACA